MAHISGNATWVDYPSTSTLITAASQENVENRLDKVALQYSLTMPTAYTNVTAAYSSPTQVGSTLTIPDPGCSYILHIAGNVVTRSGAAANQRTDLSLRLTSMSGTELLHITGNPTLPANTFVQLPLIASWPLSGKLTGSTTILLGAGVFPSGVQAGATVTGQVGGQSGFDPGNFLNVTMIPA